MHGMKGDGYGRVLGHQNPIEKKVLTYRNSISLPACLSLEAWKSVGEKISRLHDASAWWLGDWLVYGQDLYPDRYRSAVEETSLGYQTLRNYAWIARRFTTSRRRSGLSLQHHAEVAALPDAEQDLWLDQAEAAGWSRNQLRHAMRSKPRSVPPADREGMDTIRLTVPRNLRLTWEIAAAHAQCDLAHWMIATLDSVVGTRPRATADHSSPPPVLTPLSTPRPKTGDAS
ncbi:LmbU family transcriptional regulator [Streptomyces sp. NPDC127098]|uniref:LmbU family transcriptional regulator n=1 Tax=Streptomyces sp. NPDC127098 TaxID=3347137 RepID=UPI0036514153